MAMVRVSNIPFVGSIESMRLGAGDTFFLIAGNFDSSKEFANMISIVREAPDRPRAGNSCRGRRDADTDTRRHGPRISRAMECHAPKERSSA